MPRGAAFFVLIVLGAAPALAAEPPAHIAFRLDYTLEPGAQCPAEQALHDEVTRHLGYDPFRGDAPGRITVTIRRKGHQIAGQVEASGIEGVQPWAREASYPANQCFVLLSWVGNVIAFRLDEDFSLASRPKAHPPDAPSPPPSAPPLPAPPAAHESSAPPQALQAPALPGLEEPAPSGHLALALGPELTLGASGASMGALVYAGWRWFSFSLGGEFRYDAPSSSLVNTSTRSARVHAYAVGGALVPCAHLQGTFLCALLSGGAVLGDASGVSLSQSVRYPYLGGGLRLGAEQAFKPWLGVRLHMDGLVMFRTTVASLGGAPVQVPTPLSSRVNGAAGLDLMTYF